MHGVLVGGAIRNKLIWIASVSLFLGLGIFLGAFMNYAVGVDQPITSKPIKIDFCFLFSHEDLFRGQPVETQVHYTQGMEGGGIGKEECPEDDATFSGPPESDPMGREWVKDLETDWYTAEFNLSFVGVIPSHPRYRKWYSDARNGWRSGHHVPFIQILRLTHFERTR